MIRKFLTAILLSVLATSASAATLNECDHVSSVRNLWEPWEDYTKTYANGNIRIAAVDTGGEPVCCSQHLVIISPHPEWGQTCAVLSSHESLGFLDVYFDEITTEYDPTKGLLLKVPVGYYDYNYTGVERFNPETIGVRINQATGTTVLE